MCRLCQDKGALAATANALLLHKCLKQRMWDSTGVEVRQLPGIGRLLGDRLAGAGLGKLRQLAAADPRRIEAITQRNFPFGVLPLSERLSQLTSVFLLFFLPIYGVSTLLVLRVAAGNQVKEQLVQRMPPTLELTLASICKFPSLVSCFHHLHINDASKKSERGT